MWPGSGDLVIVFRLAFQGLTKYNFNQAYKLFNLYKLYWGGTYAKTISSSDLRTHIKRVLNEVGYSGPIHRGEIRRTNRRDHQHGGLSPAAIRQAAASYVLASGTHRGCRAHSQSFEADELENLIEEARAEFHAQHNSESDDAGETR